MVGIRNEKSRILINGSIENPFPHSNFIKGDWFSKFYNLPNIQEN